MPIYANKVRNGPASANEDLSTAQTAAMCAACCDNARPPLPIPPFAGAKLEPHSKSENEAIAKPNFKTNCTN